MAKIKKEPKVILTQEERETLNKTRKILAELGVDDSNGYIFDSCDNDESEIWWVERFLAKLINMSEVENNG